MSDTQVMSDVNRLFEEMMTSCCCGSFCLLFVILFVAAVVVGECVNINNGVYIHRGVV